MYAAEKRIVEAVKLLLQHEMGLVNNDGHSALILASCHRVYDPTSELEQSEIVRMLLEEAGI